MGQRGPNAKPVRANPRPTRQKPGLTRAEAVIAFVERLMITSGAEAGTRLRLRPWQRRAVATIYATDGAGRRPIRTAVISTGRKAGKTTFCAALTLAHLCGPEARRRGQIVSCGSDRAQAALLFNEVHAFAMADENLSARLIFRTHNKTVEDALTGSTLVSLSSDAAKAHGLSPTVAICDEVAQWRSRALLDAVQTGTGAHAEPLMLVISTRSVDPDSPLEQLISYGQDVASGAIDDPGFATFVYTAAEGLDPFSHEAWDAANPDMTPERLADIEALAKQARRLPSMLPAFEAFVCNRPVPLDDRWLGPVDWDACSASAELSGPVFAGLDLSSGSADLTSIALYAPETRALRVWGFIPETRIAAAAYEDRAPYEEWRRAGFIIAVPGKVIDREWLGCWLAERMEAMELVSVASDRWLLTDLMQQWDRAGLSLPLVPVGMGFKDMTGCIAAMESQVISGRLRHGGNPLLRWSVANVAVSLDPAGNRKPDKMRSRGRIDPAVASMLAIGQAERMPAALTFGVMSI